MSSLAQKRIHVVVGDRQLVFSALERAHADGRLVSVTGVEELPERRIRVTAELRDLAPPPASPPPWRRLRRGLIGAAVLVSLAAITALVWLLVAAVLALVAMVSAIVTWVAAHVVAIAVVLGAVLVLSCSVGAKCAGLHCGGCRG